RYEHPNRDPLQCGARTDAVVGFGENRRRRSERKWNRGNRRPRNADAENAAGNSERHHLKEVNRDDLAAAAAETFQYGDAFDLLKDEHPDHARYRNAAEDHN